MSDIELTIIAGSQVVNAYRAIKTFAPSIMLGPTLHLLRSKQSLHIDIAKCTDLISCFSSLLRLLDSLEELQIAYEIDTWELIGVDEEGPNWTLRASSKSELVASLAIENQKKLDRDLAIESRKLSVRPERSNRNARINEIFHQRWGQHGLDGLLPEERDRVLLWVLHSEVSNGTFDQYLYNSSGNFAIETVDILRRIGAETIADILVRVLNASPGGWCADRVERIRRLAATPDRYEVFRALTDEYYDAIETETKGSCVVENLWNAYVREGLITEPSHPTGESVTNESSSLGG